MKVLQVVPNWGSQSTGPSQSVPNMCRGLRAAGVDAQLLTMLPKVDYPFPATFCKKSWYSPTRLWFSSDMKRRLLKACEEFDIINSSSMWMMPDAYPGLCVGQYRWAHGGRGPKYVCSPRGAIASWTLRKNWLVKKIFGMLWQWPAVRQADMFHATSEKEYEEIRAAGFKQPIALVPIGMEIPVSGGEERGIGYGERLKRVVFFGRLHVVKAVDRLVKAWELLHSNTYDSITQTLSRWELVIAGPDWGVRDELVRYVSERKLPRVRFVDELAGQAKFDFLASADLYVLPSMTENFGITIAEALACGTPVVVSKGTPWPGVVENGCGWWVENEPEVLAQTLVKAMALSNEERARMGEAGRKWIERDFSVRGVGEKMKAAYEWLLDPDHVRRPAWVKM